MKTEDRMLNNMTYSEAIEQVLLRNNYVASLQTIYKELIKYRTLTGKTPFNTIQERVQRDPRFRRLERGVYALTSFLDKLPASLQKPKTQDQQKERLHFRMQGMLIETGNAFGYKTYSANKNAEFAGKKLEEYSSLSKVPPFTYSSIISKSTGFDVIWFHDMLEMFPSRIYEVDTCPSFQRSLLKFLELRYFNVTFAIVSAPEHENQFRTEMRRDAFREIEPRVKFLSYRKAENMYFASLQQFQLAKEFF